MRSGRCGQADGFGVAVMKNRPMTRVNLDKAIARMAGDDPRLTVDMRMSMANAIVGQFLPEGVVKGGTSLKFRFGEGHARYTLDLDTAWKTDLDTFLSKFRRNLANGWEGFSGELIVRPQASPRAIPFEYVMQPCDVRLSYMGRSWCTIRLEVGHNEVGDADEAEMTPVPEDLAAHFRELCFPVPGSLPLMKIPFQIAQKLHGATGEGSRRAHDLIDLQLIANAYETDFKEMRDVCERLFRYRKCQPWPPKVTEVDGWDDIYLTQKLNLPVLPTVDQAIEWANGLIARIAGA